MAELKTKEDALKEFYNQNLKNKATLEIQYKKVDRKEDDAIVDQKRGTRGMPKSVTAAERKLQVGNELRRTIEFLELSREELTTDTPELGKEILEQFEDEEDDLREKIQNQANKGTGEDSPNSNQEIFNPYD